MTIVVLRSLKRELENPPSNEIQVWLSWKKIHVKLSSRYDVKSKEIKCI